MPTVYKVTIENKHESADPQELYTLTWQNLAAPDVETKDSAAAVFTAADVENTW